MTTTSPATMVANEIVTESIANMALVVLVFGDKYGKIAIDYGVADRELPVACAPCVPELQTMLEAIRDDVHRRIDEFGEHTNWKRVYGE